MGELEWITGLGESVVAYTNRGITVVANTGQVPVELPIGTLLASSGPVTGGSLPADTTVWLKLAG